MDRILLASVLYEKLETGEVERLLADTIEKIVTMKNGIRISVTRYSDAQFWIRVYSPHKSTPKCYVMDKRFLLTGEVPV